MKSNRDKRSALKWLALAAIVGSMGLGGCGWDEGKYEAFQKTFGVDSPEQFDLSNNACNTLLGNVEDIGEYKKCDEFSDEVTTDDDGSDKSASSKVGKKTQCQNAVKLKLMAENEKCLRMDSAKFEILTIEDSKRESYTCAATDVDGKNICSSNDEKKELNFDMAYNYRQCPTGYKLSIISEDAGNVYKCVKAVCVGTSVDIFSDSKNCGECEKVCGSGDKCEDGQCVQADTTKVYCNGKYIDPLSDMFYCGASGDCTGDNRGKTCPSGTSCQKKDQKIDCVEGCIEGQILCNGKCIIPESDMMYCGASGDCTGDNRGKTCPSGTSCQKKDQKIDCVEGCIEGQILCNGKCIIPESDMMYCGASGDCAGGNRGKTCPSGTSCQKKDQKIDCVEGCIEGQILCNGKCITPETDMIYCGASGDCIGNNKGKTCPSGTSCQGGICKKGCIDGQVLCDGKCITSETDMIYCGASDDCTGDNKGKTCPSGTSCQGGTCEAGCIDGQVLCDGKCITPGTDMIYCGASGDCSGQNKGKTCPSGTSCQGGTCEAGCIDGQVLCDGKCITPGTDMIYCGASGDCSGQNKGKTCPSGTSCQGGTCEAGCVSGQVLCDGKCITPGTDMIYCGASGDCLGQNKGKTCPSGTSCQGGTCKAGCVSGQVLCDGKCITSGTDMIYCGASGDCSGQNKGKTCPSGTSCQGGTCEAGCVSGQVLCDGKCITPGTDMIYCGASGNCVGDNKGKTCPSGTSCKGGTCETGCVSGQVLCDGKCITPGTDMIYCGASGDCLGQNKGKTCPSGTSCQGGTCKAGCVSGQVLCDGKCITPGTDMIYCGASGDCLGQNKGKTCPSGTSCQGGTCEAGCVSGQVLCDGKCVTPDTDINNCGTCGTVCLEKIANSSAVECNGGNCSVKTCSKGYVLNQAKDACIVSTALDCCGKDCLVCQNISGWKEGTCSTDADGNGKCFVTACIAGYVAQDGKCVGSGCTNDFVCTGATNRCENGQCVCGSSGVCGGSSPYCGGETGDKEATCVECTEENHCATQKADSYQCDQETHTCSITCFPGYYYDQRQCKQNDNDHCGAVDKKCVPQDGEKKSVCKSGTNNCVATECKAGFYLDNGTCKINDNNNCGSKGWSCTANASKGESKVICKSGTNNCEVKECNAGFYLYEGKCNANGNDNCGAKNKKCSGDKPFCAVTDAKCVACLNAEACANAYGGVDGECIDGVCSFSQCQDGFYNENGECKPNDNENCGKKGETCTTGKIKNAIEVTCVGKTQCEVVKCGDGSGTIVSTSRDKCEICQNDKDCGSEYGICKDSKCKIDASLGLRLGNWQTVKYCWRDETGASKCERQ